MDDLLSKAFINHRDMKVKAALDLIKDYKSREYELISQAVKKMQWFLKRQTRDNLWRFRKKIRELYPKETLIYAV